MIDRAKQLRFTVKHIGLLLWRADKKLLLIQVFINIFVSVSLIPTLKLDSIVLDKIISSVGSSNISQSLWSIGYIVAIRFAISTLVGFLQRISNALNRLLSLKFRNLLEQQLSQQFASIDVDLVESAEFKNRYQRIEREGIDRSFTLVSSFVDIPNYLSGMISALLIFIFVQPLIVVFTLVFLIPIMLVDSRLIKKSYEIEKLLSNAYRGRGMVIYYLIRAKSYMELRLLGISNFLLNKLTEYQNEILIKRTEREKERVGLRFLANLPQDFFSSSLNIYFAYLAISQTISIGTAQIFIRATNSFRDNLSGLIGAVLQFYENYLYVSDVVWYLNLKPKKSPDIGLPFPSKINQGIRFDHVWFKYPESENWTLKDVSFEIGATENVAIVGENGAGKTTLIKLLAGFYQPTKGNITIDGIDIHQYIQNQYWQKLSIFFQEYETYDFSSQETIGYGNVSRLNDLNVIDKYAQMTGIDKWINSLPNKYLHPLSRSYEKGISPSTGQWQRLALTRSLIKDAQVVVLDEPTSNVDPKAEEDIFTEVLNQGKNKILIFISHRFSTVRRADKIILLEHGSVKESGSHEKLIKQKGLYAKLFKLQAKNYQ